MNLLHENRPEYARRDGMMLVLAEQANTPTARHSISSRVEACGLRGTNSCPCLLVRCGLVPTRSFRRKITLLQPQQGQPGRSIVHLISHLLEEERSFRSKVTSEAALVVNHAKTFKWKIQRWTVQPGGHTGGRPPQDFFCIIVSMPLTCTVEVPTV